MIRVNNPIAYKKAFIISAIYVGIGTFSLLGIMTNMPFYNGLYFIGVIICLPVDFIGIAILFTMGSKLWLIILIQILMFIILWYLLYKVFSWFENKRR